jgi:structure-specific endonuclease subunit SLX1
MAPVELKPIPAFYCCYLLRSTVRKASQYIGSTPHPSRRLGQHNGRVVGGAARTSRASLRPWEMACIVAGFPSNIAALQFEWAWHNSHLTRHISSHQRLSFATTLTKTSRTGKTRKRPGRPRTSLLDKLSNLHLLLRVPYFSRWPLEVRFFNEDVYHSWQSWCERVDEQLHPSIKVILDLPQRASSEESEITSAQPAKRRRIDMIGKGGVDGIDPTYARFQDVLEKSKFLLDEGDGQKCRVCSKELNLQNELVVICPTNGCRGLNHLTCLSMHFLRDTRPNILVPDKGTCPSCGVSLRWADLVRELSLRIRGGKEVQKLLSKKKKNKIATAAEILDTESEDDAAEDDLVADIADENDVTDDDEDAMSVTSVESMLARPSKIMNSGRLERVIENSDDDI